MIGDVLVFLRDKLDAHLCAEYASGPNDPVSDKVVFVEGDKLDPLMLPPGAVSILLINVSEERVLRSADPYVRRNENGEPLRVMPDVRLVLHVLFVARFKQYDAGWQHLSKIIEYLQSKRTFQRDAHPELPASVEKLVVELFTLEFAQQNEVWSALRTAYHPSLLYRIHLLAIRDREPQALDQLAGPPEVDVGRIP